MMSAIELLSTVQTLLSEFGAADALIDETSRKILFQIADNERQGKCTTVSDVTHTAAYGTVPTAYSRLRRLIELDLVASATNPSDRRSSVLRLTQRSMRLVEATARLIREAAAAKRPTT